MLRPNLSYPTQSRFQRRGRTCLAAKPQSSEMYRGKHAVVIGAGPSGAHGSNHYESITGTYPMRHSLRYGDLTPASDPLPSSPGSLSALLLAKAGFQVDVYERSKALDAQVLADGARRMTILQHPPVT